MSMRETNARASRAASSETSVKDIWQPAAAAIWAMPRPITPAPMTPTLTFGSLGSGYMEVPPPGSEPWNTRL